MYVQHTDRIAMYVKSKVHREEVVGGLLEVGAACVFFSKGS